MEKRALDFPVARINSSNVGEGLFQDIGNKRDKNNMVDISSYMNSLGIDTYFFGDIIQDYQVGDKYTRETNIPLLLAGLNKNIENLLISLDKNIKNNQTLFKTNLKSFIFSQKGEIEYGEHVSEMVAYLNSKHNEDVFIYHKGLVIAHNYIAGNYKMRFLANRFSEMPLEIHLVGRK